MLPYTLHAAPDAVHISLIKGEGILEVDNWDAVLVLVELRRRRVWARCRRQKNEHLGGGFRRFRGLAASLSEAS